MTLNDVRTVLARIKAERGDNEMAHAREDDLYRDVLKAIAEGAPEAPALAALALTASEIEFDRWYA